MHILKLALEIIGGVALVGLGFVLFIVLTLEHDAESGENPFQ